VWLSLVAGCVLSPSAEATALPSLRANASGDRLSVLQGRFRRTLVDQAVCDTQTVVGSFAYVVHGRVRLTVETPLRQELCVDDQGLLIYYPDEQRALQVLDPRQALAFRFVQIAHRSSLPDFDLGAAGATLIDYASRGDTLETRWAGPTSTPWRDQQFVLVAVGSRLVHATQTLADGTPVMDIELLDHVVLDGIEIPQRFTLREHGPSGERIEVVQFWELRVNQTSPDSIGPLNPPDAVKPVSVEW
jgi:hypothetical protein